MASSAEAEAKAAVAEENGGGFTGTEEETIAFQKKRSRRVSFAETTAIHLFTRDDEYETPPDPAAGSSEGAVSKSESDQIRELLYCSDDDDDDQDGGGDDAGVVQPSFFTPMESPSGSVFGSATSNDEDNFFGPVSMDFIKPGQLSHSADSDEIHDITMDSTAFSMHYRSLARSDSGGDFKTPTEIRTHLAFDERTPGQVSTANSLGDSMVLTAGRKPVLHSSDSADRVYDSAYSDDMTLVSENPHRYDYAKLPPELDVLLAEGGEDVGTGPLNSHDPLKKDTVYASGKSTQEPLNVAHNICADISHVNVGEMTPIESFYVADIDFHKKIDGVTLAPVGLDESHRNKSVNPDEHPVNLLPIDDQVKALQENVTPFDKDEKARKVLTEASGKFDSPSSRTQSNLNHEQPSGSISSMLAKRRKIFKTNSSNNEWILSPAKEIYNQGSSKHIWSTSSFSKGASRLKRLEAFPFATTSKAEGTVSRLLPPRHPRTPVANNDNLSYSTCSNISINNVNVPVARLEARFSDVANDERQPKNKTVNNDLRAVGNKAQAKDTVEVKDVKSTCSPSSGWTGKFVNAMNFSPSTGSHKKELDHFSSLESGVLTTGSNHSTSFLSNSKGKSNDFFSNFEYAKLDDQESQLQDGNSLIGSQNGVATSTCFQTVVNRVSDSHELYSLSDDVQTGKTLTSTAEETQNIKPNAGFNDVFDRANEFPTPRCSQLMRKYDEDDKVSKKATYVCGSDSSFTLKSKGVDLVDEADHHIDETLSLHLKLQSHKDHIHCEKGSEVSCSVGADANLRCWDDVFTSFCGATKELFSPLIDKHDLALIEKLGDILVHLEKIESYKHLYHNTSFQKTFDLAKYLHNKRLADMKLLLYRTVFKKAQLQLLRLKRDTLSDQLQQLNSRVQESEALVSSFLRSRVHDQSNIQVDNSQPDSIPADIDDNGLAPTKFSSLRKELEVSNRKIENLKESFCIYFKAVEEPTCTNMTEYTQKFLKKRVLCRSLRSDLQLWEIESLESKKGQHNFLFNHNDFLSQRLSVNLNSTSVMSVSKELNSLKISTMFQNMDASTAFLFVFSSASVLTYTGLRSISQEAQKTNSVLHNLLDVVEEVELALMELRNFTHARFFQPSAGKLDLQMCFSNFKSGARVSLRIDVSCLSRGVYPSEALPYEVHGRVAGNEDMLEMLVTNIKNGLKGLKYGYLRIIRMCRRVSSMMQDNGNVIYDLGN